MTAARKAKRKSVASPSLSELVASCRAGVLLDLVIETLPTSDRIDLLALKLVCHALDSSMSPFEIIKLIFKTYDMQKFAKSIGADDPVKLPTPRKKRAHKPRRT